MQDNSESLRLSFDISGLFSEPTTRAALSDREKGASVQHSNLKPETAVERELLDLVDQKLAANPKLQYHEALKLVASERPELDRRYSAIGRGVFTGRE